MNGTRQPVPRGRSGSPIRPKRCGGDRRGRHGAGTAPEWRSWWERRRSAREAHAGSARWQDAHASRNHWHRGHGPHRRPRNWRRFATTTSLRCRSGGCWLSKGHTGKARQSDSPRWPQGRDAAHRWPADCGSEHATCSSADAAEASAQSSEPRSRTDSPRLRPGGAGSSSTTRWPLRLPDLHLRCGPFSYFRRCCRLERRRFGDPDRRPSGGQLGLEGLDDLGGHGGEIAVPRAAPSRRWQPGWCTCRGARGAG